MNPFGDNKIRALPIVMAAVSFVLLVVVLGFSGWLSVASLKKNYSNSIVASYAVAGGEAKRKLEYAVRYGKPLTNFLGARELLAQVKACASGVKDVRVIGIDGRILYALDEGVAGLRLTPALTRQINFADGPSRAKPHQVARDGGLLHVFLPVRDKDGRWIGSLSIVFGDAVITDGVAGFARDSMRNMLLIAIASALVLAALFQMIPLLDGEGRLRRNRLLALFALILGTGQFCYGYLNSTEFKRIYLEIATENVMRTAEVIGDDINRVVGMGVPYAKLLGLDEWLNRTMKSVPEIGSIRLADSVTGKILYATKSADGDAGRGRAVVLKSDSTGVGGSLTVALSERYVSNRSLDIVLDMLTVGLTSFFFMIEIVIAFLLLAHIRSAASRGKEGELGGVAIIRPLAFMFFIATDMSISFIPVHMKQLYEPLFGLSESAVLSLPISLEMLCASLSAISTGFLIDRKGWRLPFFVGLSTLGIGLLLSGLAWSALSFIAARGVVGIGYGFSWMAMRGYVAASRLSADRAVGFAQLNAGIYAGNICACALGAMLAERVGYSGVFFAACAVACLVAAFATFCVSDASLIRGAEVAGDAAPRHWREFFGNTGVWTLFLLITIPSAMCLTGFLNYYFPLLSHDSGVSPSNIGRAFMIYGVCIVYLGPLCGKYLAAKGNLRPALLAGSCIGVAAMFLFSFKGGIAAALVAVLLFGFADSIGFVAQNVYLLSLGATREFGQGKALGFFSMAKKLGQMLGPVAVAWGVGCGATQQGVGMVGALYLMCVITFAMIVRRTVRA